MFEDITGTPSDQLPTIDEWANMTFDLIVDGVENRRDEIKAEMIKQLTSLNLKQDDKVKAVYKLGIILEKVEGV
jgi:hypothetical protein